MLVVSVSSDDKTLRSEFQNKDWGISVMFI